MHKRFVSIVLVLSLIIVAEMSIYTGILKGDLSSLLTLSLDRGLVQNNLAAVASIDTDIIPVDRLVDWTPGISVGVPGGIPARTKIIDVTASPYFADKSGATSAVKAIQAAIDSAEPQDVVYLPAGRYLVDAIIYVRGNSDNITIRGDGNSTILDARTGTVFHIGSESDYAWGHIAYAYPSSGNIVTSGMYKGSTILNISDTSAFSPGQMIQIALDNQTDDAAIMAGAIPVVGVGGIDERYPLRRQMSRVVGKTGSSLTIFPPVHFTPDSNLTARVHVTQAQLDGFGLENLYITGENGGSALRVGVQISQCYACWVKNVSVFKSANYFITFESSLNVEVRGTRLSTRNGAGSNGAALLMNHVGNALIENNIFTDVFPPVEINTGSTGNVVAYNFIYNEIGGNLNVNHGPHNSFNLFEGNVTPNIQSDGFFGGASENTFFRNWIHGKLFESGSYTSIIGLNRFSRNFSFVGNILGSPGWPYGPVGYSFGNPNMGNGEFISTAQPSAGDFWLGWKATAVLTTRTSDTEGKITVSDGTLYPHASVSFPHYLGLISSEFTEPGIQIQAYLQEGKVFSFFNANRTLPPEGTSFRLGWGPQGFQELDLDVGLTSIRKANYHAWSDGGLSIPSTESIGSLTLPNSLYLSSKPAWFGDLAWPPFDPYNPNLSYDAIPSGYRYLHGINPPGVNDDNPPPPPAATSYTLTVSKSGTGTGTISGSGISCGSTCSVTLPAGSIVTLSASPSSGSTFSGWGGACSGTGSCSLTLSSNSYITATFTESVTPPPPAGEISIYTGDASSITSSSATLNGSIIDVGSGVTSRGFEYGLSESYGSQSILSGNFTAGSYSSSISSLSCDTVYHFRAVASNSSSKAYGLDSTFTTPSCTVIDTTPPTAPTNLRAIPSTSKVDLSWSPSTDNVAVTGYRIYRNGSFTPIGNVMGTSFTDSNLSSNTTYTYGVSAYDAAGNVSPQSTISVTTSAITPITVGSQVYVTQTVKVRSSPQVTNKNTIGMQKRGATGKVTGGPVQASGYTWWQVDYASGSDGWTAGSYLSK